MLKDDERLTKKSLKGNGYRNVGQIKWVVERLGLYEDTGLMPLEIRELTARATAKMPVYEGEICADGKVKYNSWACPSCGRRYLLREEYEYCPKCGQKIERDQNLWAARMKKSEAADEETDKLMDGK